jgi:hypothetical protein
MKRVWRGENRPSESQAQIEFRQAGAIFSVNAAKILYGHTTFSKRHGGIARYFVELASRMDGDDEVLVFAKDVG